MMPPDEPRYVQITRRTFLRRAATLGLAAAVPGAVLAACSSDADVFASATSTTVPAAGIEPTTTEPAGGDSLPAGAEVVIDFTYEAGSSRRGPVLNPYVAVWVEDEDGDLVATIALWFMQSRKGLEWLSDLRRWATVDGSDATIDTVSGATRAPGTYQVVWDGTTIDRSRVALGIYYLAIEAAREHGPYSLIRQAVTLGEEAFRTTLEPDGELADAAVSLVLA